MEANYLKTLVGNEICKECGKTFQECAHKNAGAYELRTLVQNNEIVNFAIQM